MTLEPSDGQTASALFLRRNQTESSLVEAALLKAIQRGGVLGPKPANLDTGNDRAWCRRSRVGSPWRWRTMLGVS